jgi:hypothetical protein
VRPSASSQALALAAYVPISTTPLLSNFILYSRSYCHLCDDMLAALYAHPQASQFRIEVLDVDTDEDLVRQYDELVPVLIGIKPNGPEVRICHYFLDQVALNAFLSL